MKTAAEIKRRREKLTYRPWRSNLAQPLFWLSRAIASIAGHIEDGVWLDVVLCMEEDDAEFYERQARRANERTD